ncbi:alpha-2,8-sialyltransferase 8E-like [Glandiceps talaboti]
MEHSLQLSVIQSFNSTWTFNATAADEFRSFLSKDCETSSLFVVTKNNTEQNTSIQYVMQRKSTINITQDIHSRFPKEIPLKPRQYKKCSIVGNSGILLGSNCGKSIDSADYVFRYSSLDKKGKAKLGGYIQENYEKVIILMTPFAYKFSTKYTFKVQDTIESINTSVVFLHPQFTRLAGRFWKTRGITPRQLSTVFTAAFAFCEELHLYGFWPFAEDRLGHAVPYHYYNDNIQQPGGKHRMPMEFKKLIELHKQQIIHLHIDTC